MLLAVLLFAPLPLLWQDSGPVESISFERPARAVRDPQSPFQFLYEDLSGNSPKVLVRDASGIEWQVKGGPEGRAEAFVSRIAYALGYYTDAICFVKRGHIGGIRERLKRASGFIDPDGSFTYAAFERREPGARFRGEQGWNWTDNPFSGTRELKGLKILVMLVSDWDNKDSRDRRTGSNTGIIEMSVDGQPRSVFFVDDWGQSMGAWGRFFGRSNWNCDDYTRQTRDFISGVYQGRIWFGYAGQHTGDFTTGITVADVQWLMLRLGRITDEQIRAALRASGASPEEEDCFSKAFRTRVEALRRAAGN